MYWLYQSKMFSDNKRKLLFVRKFIKHYKKFVRYNFCCDLPEVPETDKALVIKSQFNMADSFEINYDKYWDIAFSYLQKEGLNLSEILREIISNPILKLYVADSDFKPFVSPLDWFQAKGYINHKGQDHYHLWWLKMNCNGLTEEQRKKKVINCVEQGYLPLEFAGDYIFY